MRNDKVMSYPRDFYNPITLKRFNEQELRTEYRRLREIAYKRIDRLGKSEFMTPENARQRKTDFPPASDLSTPQLHRALSDLGGFIGSALSTVTGQKNKRDLFLQSMQERGYTFLNKSNYREFSDFMTRLHPYINSQVISSANVLEEIEREYTANEQDFTKILASLEQYAHNVARIKASIPKYKNKTLSARDVEKILSDRRGKKQLSRYAREERKKARKNANKKRRK